jgi:hypothetical protein
MIPPVDVPTMRSKYSETGAPSDSSKAARKDAGTTPFIPPPSMLRIRLNICSFLAYLGILSLAPVFGPVWMSASA